MTTPAGPTTPTEAEPTTPTEAEPTTPTVGRAHRWRPDSLLALAEAWDRAADAVYSYADDAERAGRGHGWAGAAADAAGARLTTTLTATVAAARALVEAAAAARSGAEAIGAARAAVLELVRRARDDGFLVADDGAATPAGTPELVRVLAGDAGAEQLMAARAVRLTATIRAALRTLGEADAEAAVAVRAALTPASERSAGRQPASTHPAAAGSPAPADIVAGWSTRSQEDIGAQLAALTEGQRRRLVQEQPGAVGNTDGVPWPMRVAANRINIADAILAERAALARPDEDKVRAALGDGLDPASAERVWASTHTDPTVRAAALAAFDRDAHRRIAFYRDLLAEVPDPTGHGGTVERQVLAFDPARGVFVEAHGDVAGAHAVGVLVPGLNTTVAGSAGLTAVARRFVAAGRGEVAMITYLGGPFPTGAVDGPAGLATGLLDAADPRYALDMAPRLVAFSAEVDRAVGATGRAVPVTYIGHSYGGSILGTAEALGLTADRTVYVEAAGAGVGVHHPADWHNRNPDVLRFSMTAPGDPIELVQGIPMGPHGADPDEMAGVVRLDTGRRLDGSPMAGPAAHSDVLTEPSDAWRNLLAVITGDRESIRVRNAAR